MNVFLLIPLLLGPMVVLQAGLNREIAGNLGVAQTVLISNMLTITLCLLLYFFCKYNAANVPGLFPPKSSFWDASTYRWWYVFPGLFGFLLVAGAPLAISKLGAVQFIVCLIAAQMVTSVLWDVYVLHLTVNVWRVVGMIGLFASVLLITLKK